MTDMRFIGITGGVGAGKSLVLARLAERCRCRILLADEVGNEVKQPGEVCYGKLVELLGDGILTADGSIDRRKMAAVIFSDPRLLGAVNEIIHPEVRRRILQEVERERERGEADFFFLEAALLIECGYEAVLDELWYVHADREIRRTRLKENRGYSDEKIDQIFASQLPEEAFYAHCCQVIVNNGDVQETYRQIEEALLKQADGSNRKPKVSCVLI